MPPDEGVACLLQLGQCPFSLCSCKEKMDKKRKHARGIAALRRRGRMKQSRNFRSRAVLRARAFMVRVANGIRGKVEGISLPPFPWTPSFKRQRRGLRPSFDSPCYCARRKVFLLHVGVGAAISCPPCFPLRGKWREAPIGGLQRRCTPSVCLWLTAVHLAAFAVPGPRRKGSAREAARLRKLRLCFFRPRRRKAAIPRWGSL